jgi:hypothetical protein
MAMLLEACLRIDAALRRPLVLTLVTLALCAIAALAAARHRRPLVEDVVTIPVSDVIRGHRMDDWERYKTLALDILDHGPSMPSLQENYYTPGGFLYCYFVAGVYAMLGRNSALVYVVQAMLLPLAIALWFIVGRRVLTPPLALAYPLLTAVLLYRNMYADLTFRLLSENLVMPLIPLAVLAFIAARERDSVALHALSGVLTGIVALTRQNLEFVIPLLALVALLYGRGDRRARIVSACAFIGGAIAGLAPLAIRNGVVTGHFTIASQRQWRLVPKPAWFRGRATPLLRLFGERALYCLGILSPRVSHGVVWAINKQFLLASVAALAQLLLALRTRRLPFIDALCAAWLLAAYIPFVALPSLGGYGMRFQWPTAPLVVLLACRLVDRYAARYAGRYADQASARVTQPHLASSPRP